MEAGLGDNVDLDGGVTTRVVDGTSVNFGDRHDECTEIEKIFSQLEEKRRGKKEKRTENGER